VLVVEDGPTLTHGGMAYGAGYVAATRAGASELVDPRRFAVGSIADAYRDYPHIGPVLPALGYADEQRTALAETINCSDADVVVAATPIDLAALLSLDKPVVRARYELAEVETPGLTGHVAEFLERRAYGR
jgi:predicted GTPase